MKSFQELLTSAKELDSYWIEKAKLDFIVEAEKLMKARALTRAEVARKLNCSAPWVTKVFRGDANITIATMVRLARAMDGRLSIHITPKEEGDVNWFRAFGRRKMIVKDDRLEYRERWLKHAQTEYFMGDHPQRQTESNGHEDSIAA